MQKIRDRVSVILPTYNREKFLKRAIDEILNSEYPDIELICINDGSIDRTRSILDEYERDLTAIHLNENSGTVCVPRNVGISYSTGEYLVHADDDVHTLPNKFSILVEAIKKNPENVLSYGDRLDRHDNGREIYQKIENWNPLISTGVDNGQILYKSNVYSRVSFPWVYRACDYHLAKQIYNLGKFEYVNQLVSIYLWHGQNRSIVTNGVYSSDYMPRTEIEKFQDMINVNYFNSFLDV